VRLGIVTKRIHQGRQYFISVKQLVIVIAALDEFNIKLMTGDKTLACISSYLMIFKK
jgi:hypothetical protein